MSSMHQDVSSTDQKRKFTELCHCHTKRGVGRHQLSQVFFWYDGELCFVVITAYFIYIVSVIPKVGLAGLVSTKAWKCHFGHHFVRNFVRNYFWNVTSEVISYVITSEINSEMVLRRLLRTKSPLKYHFGGNYVRNFVWNYLWNDLRNGTSRLS